MSSSDYATSDETFHRVLVLFRYVRKEARRMNSQGIKPREFAVLRFLLESGPATVGEVQAYLYQSASTTSGLIAKLEGKGHVTRTRSRDDNRVVIVQLTASGRNLAQNTPLSGLALLRRRLKTLPDERLQPINSALVEILELMEVTDQE